MVDLVARRRREQSGPRRVGQRQGGRRMAAARRWIRFRRAVGGGPAGVIRRSGRASESCARVESGWLGDRGPTMPSRCTSPGSERVDMALEQGREVPAASGLAAIAGHRVGVRQRRERSCPGCGRRTESGFDVRLRGGDLDRRGPSYLKAYLRAHGVPDAFERWINTGEITGISQDGRILVGYGAASGGYRGYVVVLKRMEPKPWPD